MCGGVHLFAFNACRVAPLEAASRCEGVELNADDTSILASVWSAFQKVATDFPNDADVIMTLQYHGWYSAQCLRLSRLEQPTKNLP